MEAYARLLLRTDDGEPMVPADHHALWLDLLCDWSIPNLLILAPPEAAKPVSVEALVLMGDGSRKRLGSISVGDMVVTHQGRARSVTAVHKQGVLPVVKIETMSGRIVQAARDHPFLTPTGWKNAGDLVAGESLACVPTPEIGGVEAPDESFRLAGYFIGDGCTTRNPKTYTVSASITCNDPIEEADIRHCAQMLGYTVSKTIVKGRETAPTIGLGGGVRQWLRDTGLAGCSSHTKRVPEFVFRGSHQQIAQFIGAYFACDGSASLKGPGKQRMSVDIGSVNRPLLEDVQHLLLRLGIQSTVRQHDTAYLGKRREAFTLTIGVSDAVARFIEQVPIHHEKAVRLSGVPVYRQHFNQEFLPDKIRSIEPSLAECRCLTVEEDSTFTANDLVVHNTSWVLAFIGVYVGVYPENQVILVSTSGATARKRSDALRATVRTSGWQTAFPDVRPVYGEGLRWTMDEWSLAPSGIAYPGRLHPTVSAFGTGGKIIGARGDLLLADDLLDMDNTRTPESRAKIRDWIHSSFLSRRKARVARTIVIGTPWNPDDAYEAFKKAGNWVVVRTPLLQENGTGAVFAELTYPDDFQGKRLGEPIGERTTVLEGVA